LPSKAWFSSMMNQIGCDAGVDRSCAVQMVKMVLCIKRYLKHKREQSNTGNTYPMQSNVNRNKLTNQRSTESLKMSKSHDSQSCQVNKSIQESQSSQVNQSIQESQSRMSRGVQMNHKCETKIDNANVVSMSKIVIELMSDDSNESEMKYDAWLELKVNDDTNVKNDNAMKLVVPIYQSTQPTRFKIVKIDTKEAYLKRNEAHSQYFWWKPCDQIGIKAGREVGDELSAQFERDNAEKVSDDEIIGCKNKNERSESEIRTNIHRWTHFEVGRCVDLETVREQLGTMENEMKARKGPSEKMTIDELASRKDEFNHYDNVMSEMIPEMIKGRKRASVREVRGNERKSNAIFVRKCVDIRDDNEEATAKGIWNKGVSSQAIVHNSEEDMKSKINESKKNKILARGQSMIVNDSVSLPSRIWKEGLSAERIRLTGLGAIKNVDYNFNAAHKNFVLLIAFVASMMRKIESRTWWWFDGMMKF